MISVCIATYNGERFIRQQLESILSQIGLDDEIIVSDNGSSDTTVDIVKNLGDTRIRVIDGPKQHSVTLNFENALRHARGKYIFLSDQDDIWKPNKVAMCIKELEYCDCVVTDASMSDERLEIKTSSYFSSHGTHRSRLYNTLIKNGYMGCCMAFRRKVLDCALPFPAGIPLHDIWIGNIAAWKYRLSFIDEPLTIFRCHGKNSSPTALLHSRFAPTEQFIFRWAVVKNLIKRLIFKLY